MLAMILPSFIVATVLLTPKPGEFPIEFKKASSTTQKIESQDEATKEKDVEVVLRKAKPKIKKSKFAKNKKAKKFKGKLVKESIQKEQDPDADIDENLDVVYQKEVKFLKSKKEFFSKSRAKSAEYRMPNSVSDENYSLLGQVQKKYMSQFVQMQITKEVTQAILEKTRTYNGSMAVGPRGLLKMDIEQPQKSSLIMDGKNIWVVDYPVDDMQNKVQILHSKAKKTLKNQAFLGSLLSGGKWLKDFHVEEIKTEKNKKDAVSETKFRLIPREKDLEIQKIELSVDPHEQLITNLSYWDQLGNKTEFKFTKQEFKPEVPKDFFKFQPPKDADVSEL